MLSRRAEMGALLGDLINLQCTISFPGTRIPQDLFQAEVYSGPGFVVVGSGLGAEGLGELVG